MPQGGAGHRAEQRCTPRSGESPGPVAVPRRFGNVDQSTEGGAIERIVGSQLNNAGAIASICSWQTLSGRPARSWLDVCMLGSSKACLWSQCQTRWAACCRRRQHTSPPALASGGLTGPRLLGARPDCWAGHLLSAAALTAALAAADAAAAAAAVQVVLCCAARWAAVTEG